MNAPDWTDAACLDEFDVFFAPKHTDASGNETDRETETQQHQREAIAKAICATCPIVSDCRDYANGTRQEFGVWGGSSAEELHNERRRIKYRASS